MRINNGFTTLDKFETLRNKLISSEVPEDLKTKALSMLDIAKLSLKYGQNLFLVESTEKYIDWIVSLPWRNESKDILDINYAKNILEKNHYGLTPLKKRILEYISILILHKEKNLGPYKGPIIFLVGLAGSGKTTFARSIAEALGREFIRIPFGGLASSLDLRGQSKLKPEAEPGLIIKGLRKTKVKNPVILLDELDRVSQSVKDEIMGVLLELLDPEQNQAFVDHYIDYPFDLSQVIFIATANNSSNISTAVLDRMEVIRMPSYSDEEKIVIARDYLFPKIRKSAGLDEDQLKIEESLWPKIIRPLGFDPGLRSLKRHIESIVRTAAYKIVSGEATSFTITEQNYKEFLK